MCMRLIVSYPEATYLDCTYVSLRHAQECMSIFVDYDAAIGFTVSYMIWLSSESKHDVMIFSCFHVSVEGFISRNSFVHLWPNKHKSYNEYDVTKRLLFLNTKHCRYSEIFKHQDIMLFILVPHNKYLMFYSPGCLLIFLIFLSF